MVKRIFVEKKDGYNVSAKKTSADIQNVLGIAVEDVREFIRYDIENLDNAVYESAKTTIFSEAPVDSLYEEMPELDGYKLLAVEFLPGQYDQRADSAMQCVQLLSMSQRPLIKCAKLYAFKGLSDAQFDRVRKYLINPVESREGSMQIPDTLQQEVTQNLTVPTIDGFIDMSDKEICDYHKRVGFAMSEKDLIFVRDYFKGEKRNPSESEIKVIDTYWSDHCRHTTFATELTKIDVDSNNPHVGKALDLYRELFQEFNAKREDKYPCLMDIATIAVKDRKSVV